MKKVPFPTPGFQSDTMLQTFCRCLDNPKTLCVRPLGLGMKSGQNGNAHYLWCGHLPLGCLVTQFLGSFCSGDFCMAQVTFGRTSPGKLGWGSGPLCHRWTLSCPPHPTHCSRIVAAATVEGCTVRVHPPLSVLSPHSHGFCRSEVSGHNLVWMDSGSPLRVGTGISLTFLPWFSAFHKRPPQHLCAELSQHLSVVLALVT